MMQKLKWLLIPSLALALLLDVVPKSASAQIVGTLPFTLQNGTIADANQVMSDLNTIVAAVNANAANAGVNTNINALNNLTTPLVYTSGGTSNYIGGTSGGSANAQTIAFPIPSGFTLIAGKSVTFVPGFTNTGPAQLNVAGTGLTNVFKQGPAGPVALSGQELTPLNLVTVEFDGTQFQIMGVSPQSLVPACFIGDYGGANGAPPGWLLLNGQLVSRTTFATLFACIAVQGVAATTTLSSASVVVPNSALFQIGWFVSGANVTCNSTIIAIPDGTHITISNTAGAGGATTLTIGPYSQGDCSTTFGVGNFLGRTTVMRDTGGTVLTATTCTNPASIGSSCGLQTSTLLTTNLPPYTPSGTVGLSASGNIAGTVSSGFQSGSGGVGITSGGTINLNLNPTYTFSGTPAPGQNSTSFSNLPPVALVDKYIKF